MFSPQISFRMLDFPEPFFPLQRNPVSLLYGKTDIRADGTTSIGNGNIGKLKQSAGVVWKRRKF